jgi:hypothetical protein
VLLYLHTKTISFYPLKSTYSAWIKRPGNEGDSLSDYKETERVIFQLSKSNVDNEQVAR